MKHMDFEEINYFGPYGLRRQHRWIDNKYEWNVRI
jgi:hypothetical protein